MVSMAQVTIYLDAETEQRMKEAAKAAGLSYSKWVAQIIMDRTRTEWPRSVAELVGAWADSDLERPTHGEDVPREPI